MGTFQKNVKDILALTYGKSMTEASTIELYHAVSKAAMAETGWDFVTKAKEAVGKKACYFSAEFLVGRLVYNNLLSLGLLHQFGELMSENQRDMREFEEIEDAALGNGGLGRLAACFLDSLATLGYSAYGCGIRYRYGMFKQKIENGYQVEVPDNWLKHGNPFELRRPEYAKVVKFGGYVRVQYDEAKKRNNFIQEGYQSVLAIPFDMPILGYNNNVVNTLRVWDAEAITNFQLDSFDKGDYQKAVEQENLAKNIVDVLYPNDNHYAGKELRLKQQYFFISASVQAAIEKYKKTHSDIRKFYEKVTFQTFCNHKRQTFIAC